MAEKKVFVNSQPRIRATFKDNAVAVVLTGATTLTIRILKPGGVTVAEEVATLESGASGIIYWDTTPNTYIDIAGDWLIQGLVVLASGKRHYSSWYTMQVGANISAPIP